MRIVIAVLAWVFVSLATPAQAEVADAGPSAFLIRTEANVAASPAEAWRALTRVDRWWNSTHTYSGNARNLRLDARAGGCWCERWGEGQSVEHGRVVTVMEHDGVQTLRVLGGFGPLQEMGVSGVMTFTVAPHASGATITLTYRVAGDAGLALDGVAPAVDMVLLEQFQRLARYTASGSPE